MSPAFDGSSVRFALTVLLALALLVGGTGSAALAYQWNQDCHETWDGVPDTYVECEDVLHGAMLYGGGLTGLLGLALLGNVGWRYRTPDPA